MGYHHKHEECSKGTREILQNVIVSSKTEYEIVASTESIKVTSPTEKLIKSEKRENVLTNEAEQILQQDDTSDTQQEQMTFAAEDGAGTEYYKSSLEITFNIEDLPESYIKKRKHSNRIDTDVDYSDV